MNDFIFHNPAKVYFGKNQLEHLPEELAAFGTKVLMVYGGGSIKKSGLYDKVRGLLESAGMELFELAGVEPNPRHTTANRGAAICRQNGIDVVLAVGGGSAIDCAKGVAAAAKTADGDVWPPGRGRRMGDRCPARGGRAHQRCNRFRDGCLERHLEHGRQPEDRPGRKRADPPRGLREPEHSYTLPAYQTACGAFDIFNHVLDNYYLAGDATFDLVLEMQEAVMRTVVKWTPVALEEPQNYEARANLMWASSMALNTVLDAGTVHGCACHMMEHELSAYYDITHGHGLAILAPRWLEYILDDGTASAIYRLGIAVFGVEEGLSPEEGARRAIERVSSFAFETLGLEGTLTELGIDEAHFQDMARHACGGGRIPGLRSLGAEDVERIYRMCL